MALATDDRRSASGETGQECLPDFRNVGVILRILVLAESARLIALLAYSPDGRGLLAALTSSDLPFEGGLLAVALSLFVCGPALRRLSYRSGVFGVLTCCAVVAGGLELAFGALLGHWAIFQSLRAAVVGVVLAAAILGYFDWRQRKLSPALVEARLMALQARIRPHFLFNSLNAAVSVVREDPRLAERVLLDMCDLFRALIADGRSLVPVEDEIRLARSYLEIEALRLGDRLVVRWDVEELPANVLVPVLLLQPLLENAVYHGIELRPEGGVISVRIFSRGGMLLIEVRNPLRVGVAVPAGNRMALANIGERLALHFDAEAQLRTATKGEEFVVTVSIPRMARVQEAREKRISREGREA